jgi:uncharacterized membrane-anchored protein
MAMRNAQYIMNLILMWALAIMFAIIVVLANVHDKNGNLDQHQYRYCDLATSNCAVE